MTDKEYVLATMRRFGKKAAEELRSRADTMTGTELIDEVVAEALRHINRKSVEYHLNVQNSEEYLLAQIDAKLIVQVIINIVDNAIKYTPAGSEIDIGWKREGNYIYISIADNGPGISDEAKPHIFDMFYSAANQIADSRRSMGLGLALCKQIVELHNGRIHFDSAPGKGTRVTVEIYGKAARK